MSLLERPRITREPMDHQPGDDTGGPWMVTVVSRTPWWTSTTVYDFDTHPEAIAWTSAMLQEVAHR